MPHPTASRLTWRSLLRPRRKRLIPARPGISNIDLVQAAGQYNCQELLDTKEKAMRKVIYSMNVSLDGFVEGPNRELDWSTPDEELHRIWNDQEREMGTSLYGRRLYELIAAYWPTADTDPTAQDYVVEFARIWRDKPKIVFSTTLEKVDWNSRLVRD